MRDGTSLRTRSLIRRFGSWMVCWNRPWAARSALIGALYGEYRCPCGNCKGVRVPDRVAHLDVAAIEADDARRSEHQETA